MKKLLILIQILFASQLQAQFKYVPADLSGAPAWAMEMYSEDANYYEVENMRREFYRNNPYNKDIHERNFLHWTINNSHRIDEDGHFLDNRPVMRERTVSRGTSSPWYPIGPMQTYNLASEGSFPVSYQCNAFCMDACESNPDILVAGIEGGDLFKSEDAGLNWFPLTEELGIRTPVATRISPADCDLIFVVANNNLYRSEDGGENWEFASSISGSVYEIELHPTDPNIVFVASSNGLFKSTEGGANMVEVVQQKAWDVLYHPTDNSIVYTLKHNATAKRCEFMKSSDGGDSFTLMDNGWYVPEDIGSAEDIGGKIGLTVAAPDQIYVSLIGASKDGDNGWIGTYKSEDAGESWTLPSGQIGGPYDPDAHLNLASFHPDGTGFHQGFYNFAMAVSQNDPDLLWVGCLALHKSEDGAETFDRIGAYYAGDENIGWVHPDVQDMVAVGDHIWLATDGGLNYSTDELATHESRIRGIYNSTFWGYAQGWNQDIQVGGRYHNGNTGYINTYEDEIHLRLGGAEQATGYVNPLLERKVYFSDIGDHYLPETLDDDKLFTANLGLYPNESYWVSESSELEFDPRYAKHLFLGRENKFYKSTNEGLSFDLTYTWGVQATVYEFEICRQDPNRIYASVRTGSSSDVYRSDDQGYTWDQLPQDPGNSSKIELAVDPANDDILWGIEVNASTVFRTTNGGESWENMTTQDLYGEQMRDIQVQAGTGIVYVSCNSTVFYYEPESGEWIDIGEGLPAQLSVLETRIFYKDSKIRLCDDGKGIWETDLIEADADLIVQAMTLTDEIFCSMDTVLYDCYSYVNHDGTTWSWSFSPEPAYVSDLNVRNPKVVFGANGSYDATLTVIDGNGQSASSTVSVTVNSGCEPDPYSGNALFCEENGDYASTTSLNRTTNEFSISAWVKPDGIQDDYSGIVMNNGTAAGMNFRGGNNTLGYHWPGGAWWFESGLVVPENEWSHVAMTVNSSGVTLYLNGVGVSHATGVENVDINTMLVGSYQGWNGRNFKGMIDEVRIYDRVLSQDEIREFRHITLNTNHAQDPNLLAYYQFNEESGDVLDKSGINHAYLNGGAYRDVSGGPFGGGEADRAIITATGDYYFSNTDTELFMENNHPDGEFVISRIHYAPNELPNNYLGYENFFVINNYGNNQFWTIEGMRLTPTDFDPSSDVLNGNEPVRLYKRGENSDLNDWIEVCESTNTTPEGIFYTSDCPVDYNLQLFPASAEFVGIEEAQEDVLVRAYPNPLSGQDQLIIVNSRGENMRIELYDMKGKLVHSSIENGPQAEIKMSQLSKGLFTYRVFGDTFIWNGHIVLQ